MNETEYLDELVSKGQTVIIRLTEGRDISAVPVSHDGLAVIIRNAHTGTTSMVYKRAISAITPTIKGG